MKAFPQRLFPKSCARGDKGQDSPPVKGRFRQIEISAHRPLFFFTSTPHCKMSAKDKGQCDKSGLPRWGGLAAWQQARHHLCCALMRGGHAALQVLGGAGASPVPSLPHASPCDQSPEKPSVCPVHPCVSLRAATSVVLSPPTEGKGTGVKSQPCLCPLLGSPQC